MAPNKREEIKVDDVQAPVVTMYPLKPYEQQDILREEPVIIMGAQLTNEISNNKTATPTPQAPTASIRLQKYRYYIVPPINLNLMEIFEK